METLQIWTRKLYVKSLTLGLGSTAGLICLYGSGHGLVATTFTVLGFGTAYIRWRNATRLPIHSKHAVIVTGCDSGLGYSLALHCRALDATVIAGVLQPDGLGARDLIRNGINVIPLDITRSESIAQFGTEARELMAQETLDLRALVNNAGMMIFGEFEWQTEEQMRRQVEVNLLGTMGITKELMPVVRSKRSRIIVVTSHCSSQPLPGVATYAATKAGLSAWTTALRLEVSKYGVEVVCFVPGSFTKDSNLLSRQTKHFADMANAMKPEARNFYGSYFTRYRRYLSEMSREIAPHKIEDPLLYQAFDGALMDVYPRSVYKCEPWRYTFYHLLFSTTPTFVRDWLVEKFVSMPRWNPSMKEAEEDAMIPELQNLKSYESDHMPDDETVPSSVKSSPEDASTHKNDSNTFTKRNNLSR
ncbi:retinol dehydrogenase 7 [Diprion similis]|uniref:retinol dehydrogenase 7 n=1 Tax=Diprion similis TaxID=362088 RepID=UPI001EF87D5B|nr:retinol dehydrogenase 7 [Diprion similis]